MASSRNLAFYALRISGEIIWDLVYFPLWWYSRGLMELVLHLKSILDSKEKSLALFVWMKNLFVPMYGQHDFWGSLISFIMRSFQIIARSLIMLFWLFLASFIVCFWVLLPPYVAYQLYLQTI